MKKYICDAADNITLITGHACVADLIVITSFLTGDDVTGIILEVTDNWVHYGIKENETLAYKIAYKFYSENSEFKDVIENRKSVFNSFTDIMRIVKEYEAAENNQINSSIIYQPQLFYGRYASLLEKELNGYRIMIPKNLEEYEFYNSLAPSPTSDLEYYDTIFLLDPCDYPVGKYEIKYIESSGNYELRDCISYHMLNKDEKILAENCKRELENIF